MKTATEKEKLYFRSLFSTEEPTPEEIKLWPYKEKLGLSLKYLIGKHIRRGGLDYIVKDIEYSRHIKLIVEYGNKLPLSQTYLVVDNPFLDGKMEIHLHPGKRFIRDGFFLTPDVINTLKSSHYKTTEYRIKLTKGLLKSNNIEQTESNIAKYNAPIKIESIKERIKSTMRERYDVDWYLNRGKHYSNNILRKIYNKYGEESFSFLGVSKKEILIISEIVQFLSKQGVIGRNIFFFSEDNDQYSFKFEDDSNLIVDFFDKDNKIVIEVNGDYIHCNPSKYSNDYFMKLKGLYAWEIWDKDRKNIERLFNEFQVNVYTIWNSEWHKNKEKVLVNLLKFYNEKSLKH